jgi:hypothetical protein
MNKMILSCLWQSSKIKCPRYDPFYNAIGMNHIL